MKMKQVLCVMLFVALAELVGLQSLQAQYYFERDPASYVRVDDDYFVHTLGDLIGEDPEQDQDIVVVSTGDQSMIASSTTSAAASTSIADLTAFSNTQMTFNPDLVANGQVSALAISGVVSSIGYPGGTVWNMLTSNTSHSKASCYAKFTLRNSQQNPGSTAIKLKIKQSSSFTADPDFDWMPEHQFSIYKNSPGGTPMLTSSTAGEVTLIDPVANPGDYYVIEGVVNAKGGIEATRLTGSIVHILGSLQVTGEADVSVVAP